MFDSRKKAGLSLADKVESEVNCDNCVVLGITRGGVVVAAQIARKLNVPLDIIVIKKIGAPGNPELAIGAVGPGKTTVWDLRFANGETLDHFYKEQAATKKEQERSAQEERLRSGKQSISLTGKDVILVDDGVATGMTVLCADKYIRSQKVKKTILAIPVIAKDTMIELSNKFDIIVALQIEKDFGSVGQFYKDFPQVEDDEVISLL